MRMLCSRLQGPRPPQAFPFVLSFFRLAPSVRFAHVTHKARTPDLRTFAATKPARSFTLTKTKPSSKRGRKSKKGWQGRHFVLLPRVVPNNYNPLNSPFTLFIIVIISISISIIFFSPLVLLRGMLR
jgi:hypothetical protein